MIIMKEITISNFSFFKKSKSLIILVLVGLYLMAAFTPTDTIIVQSNMFMLRISYKLD